MPKLIFHSEKIADFEAFRSLCPFGAIEKTADGRVEASAACKMCRICVKKSKNGEAEFVEDEVKAEEVDLSAYRDVCVLVDQTDGEIHPVTLELIGKGRELADKAGKRLVCLMLGENVTPLADELLHYPVDEIYVYDNEALRFYRAEPYTATVEAFVNTYKPSTILVGATTVGRQLAPRVAARFRTGLTADCTILDMIPEKAELVQIRPAFGGNIMAEIHTPKHRPQMATVRYKVMQAPARSSCPLSGKITVCDTAGIDFSSAIRVLDLKKKEKVKTIESADVLVVAGRGVKTKEDLALLQTLADELGGELACTRPLVENGFMEARRQIGLSGRTVRPQLIITCGVSGAVQFTAGMRAAEHIFAINRDPAAPIFEVAHTGAVGDLYEIVPALIEKIRAHKEEKAHV